MVLSTHRPGIALVLEGLPKLLGGTFDGGVATEDLLLLGTRVATWDCSNNDLVAALFLLS